MPLMQSSYNLTVAILPTLLTNMRSGLTILRLPVLPSFPRV
jgi:hypothetical protein